MSNAKDSYHEAYAALSRHMEACSVCGDAFSDEMCDEGLRLRAVMRAALKPVDRG